METARGIEYGTVLIAPREVADDQVVQPLKPVIRVATEEDTKTVERNKEREKSAYKTCLEKIAKHIRKYQTEIFLNFESEMVLVHIVDGMTQK